MKPRRREGLTIRAALLLAFGLTLGLWLFAGYFLTRRMVDVQRQTDAVNARYTRAQELLSTIRTQVLLGSVYVRDALLDPNPGATTDYRRQFDETYKAVSDALADYDPILDTAAENTRVDQLRREVEAFRAAMLDVLSSDSTRWPTEARLLIRSRIMPTRENVVQVSEEVQRLNRSAYIQQQAATGAVYAATQRRVWIQFGFALAASFGIGLFSIRHVALLEERLRQQTEREARHAHDLQRLSTQLVTAQEDERRTIARELHDEVGQVLTAIKVELAIAQRSVEACGASPAVLSNARSITDQALRTVRDLSHLLHPALLDDLGLPAAIDAHIREFSGRHGIRAELLHEQMDCRLTRDVEAAVYRIVQEALTNIVRHAAADSCRVYLQQLPNSVVITVEDDGVGFDVDRVVPAGLGLLGIRERAAQLGGTVRLESAPGKGTRLTAELPAQDPAPSLLMPTPSARRRGARRRRVPRLRILLGDDHTIVRQGVCRILEEQPDWQVVAQASDGRDALKQALTLVPDVAILDIGMPLLNGIEATRQIVRRAPDVRVLILSMHIQEAYITQALEAGATGYLLKDSADVELVGAVTAVSIGKSFFSPAVARVMLDDYVRHLAARGIADRYESLSEREREVFQLIAEGHSNKQVAEVLSISPATVETHRAHILQKLDVHNTAELVLYAVRRGIIS